MAIQSILETRSGHKCELCAATDGLSVYEVPASPDRTAGSCVLVCDTCRDQIENADKMDANHWRCLSDAMWSQEPAVQVMAYRLLNRLSSESWAQDALDMMYLEDTTREWAEKGLAIEAASQPTLDSNGVALQAGDTVTIIKDLDVKGSSLTAKRGTAVRNIALTSNPEHIEGRVNGQRIVILSCFVKKS